ncbi:YesL family protein [Domibacillus indicus]|uniref:YesL family protein n=1 Tax=Domibacillus indicus TaxID=1437523 RepID=UPI0006182D79
MNKNQNKLFNGLETVTNLFQLNILWILFCLPIITAVPATVAMYCVIRQWIIHQDPGVYRSFIRFFKENFKKSFLIGLLLYAIAGFLYLNFFSILNFHYMRPLFLAIFIAFAVLFIGFTLFLFPVMAHYEGAIKTLLRNTLFFTIGRLFTTVTLLAIAFISALTVYAVPFSFFFIVSTGSYLIYIICHKTFTRVIET